MEQENLTLGKCCACEQENESVRNILTLHKRTPDQTQGWGCFVCDLPSVGAVAVLCDGCIEKNADPVFYCIGYPGANVRGAVEDLTVDFGHDLAKHPEQWETAIFHFLTVRAAYEELENKPGMNTTLALENVFRPLYERYLGGERTQDLFDAMMAVE